MVRQRFHGWAMGLAMLVASTGCAIGAGAGGGPGQPAGGSPVRLNVTNRSGGPMEVYARGSGTEYRMGTVLPGLGATFSVRPGMVANGTVEFTARAPGGAVVRSGPILLTPGDVVDFDLEGSPVTSAAAVRPWRRSSSAITAPAAAD